MALVSVKNKYQKYFLEGKCDQCVSLTALPPSSATVFKSKSSGI